MAFPILLSINDWRNKSKNHPDDEVEKLLRAIYDSKTIYKRFDKLIALLEYCEKKSADDGLYTELASSIVAIIGHIIDDDNQASLKEKIAARKNLREYDPFYMPWVRPNPGDVDNNPLSLYETLSDKKPDVINEGFVKFKERLKNSSNLLTFGGRHADNETNVWNLRTNVGEKYYDEQELEAFRAIPYKSKLLKVEILNSRDNRRLSFSHFSTASLSIKAYDTFLLQSEDYLQTAIYTVHTNGSIFIGRSLAPQRISMLFDPEAILHPSYSDNYSELPLFMAGQIKVSTGVVQMIDGASGHYIPDYEQTSQANSFFKTLGFINNHTLLSYYRPNKGSNKKEFTSQKCTQLEAMLLDFNALNAGDLRQITKNYLKTNNPIFHTVYILQSRINNELDMWKKESSVIFDRPSLQFLKLNKAVEKFSKFGDCQHPDLCLALLTEVNEAINEWSQYHQTSGKRSRRLGAVGNLEKRVLEQRLYYSSHVFLNNYSRGIPKAYQAVITDFLSYKTDLPTTIEELKKLASSPSPKFFSEEKAQSDDLPEELSHFFNLISRKIDSIETLKEINVRLDAMNEEFNESSLLTHNI